MKLRGLVTVGFSVLLGLGLTGATVTPVPAHASNGEPPLITVIEGLNRPDGFVLNSDGTKLHVYSANGTGSNIDVVSKAVSGAFPKIQELNRAAIRVKQAVGTQVGIPTYGGYTLVNLATGEQSAYSIPTAAGQTRGPDPTHIFVDENSRVTAITDDGDFLELDGGAIVQSKPLGLERARSYRTGSTPDGSRYFTTVLGPAGGNERVTNVVDMRTGEFIGSIASIAGKQFMAITFDADGTTLWGTYGDSSDSLVQVDPATGQELASFDLSVFDSKTLIVDSAQGWFATGPLGASLADSPQHGGRTIGLFTSSLMRLPGGGDVVYFDDERGTLGLIAAPEIVSPAPEQPISAFGEDVVFTSHSRGLALSHDDEGASQHAQVGSIWQSSADGEEWVDIAGETGDTLTVTVTEESYPLQYRRLFLDRYWGNELSTTPSRMAGPTPVITRANNLPAAKVGTPYPSEHISAQGQPDLRWEAQGLPTGLELGPETGNLSGTPESSGEFVFSVQVTDAFGTDTRSFDLVVSDGAEITPTPEPERPKPGIQEPLAPTPRSPVLANTGGNGLNSTVVIGAVLIGAAAGVVLLRRIRTREAS